MIKYLKDLISKVISLNYEKEVIVSKTDLNNSVGHNFKMESLNNYKLRSFEQNDINTVMEFCEESDPTQVDFIKDLIEKECNAILFFKDKTLFGYYWWYDTRIKRANRYEVERLPMQLKSEHEIYCAYFFIKPEYRGQGIALYLLSKINSKLSNDGYTKIYGYTDNKNKSALWIYKILGSKDIKRIKEYSIIINKKKRKFFFYGTHPTDLYLFFSKNMIRFIRSVLLKRLIK